MNSKRLSAQEICEAIVSYIQDNVYQYAVMLDGEWGCGKSYLVEHEIAPMFAKDGIFEQKKYIYISLYGISSLEALEAAVSSKYMTAVLGEKGRGLYEMVSTFGPIWLKTVPWNGTELSESISRALEGVGAHLAQLKDCFFVFDDLERCCIRSVEVLGYINRLIEHNQCKVLIIANEKECGYIAKSKDELRLMAAAMIDENQQGMQQNDRVEKIQTLKEKLFGNRDALYFRTKEKLIGKTLRYEADIESIVSAITDRVIGQMIENKDINNIVSETCINVMKEERAKNIRILQYALSAFVQVFTVIQSVTMEEPEREQILRQVMNAILRISVRYKKDENVEWKNFLWVHSSVYAYVSCEAEAIKTHNEKEYQMWAKRQFLSFRFIHQYILTGKMDAKMASDDLSTYAEILHNERELNEDGYTKLKNGYWYLTEAEMHTAIAQMEERFLKNGYKENIYLQVIGISLQYYEMFQIGNPEKLCNHLLEEIKKGRISIEPYYGATDRILEGKAVERYQQYLEEIGRIKERKKEEEEKVFFNCFNRDNWSEVYKQIDHNYSARSSMTVKERFSSLINISSLVSAIEQGTAADIYYVMRAFEWVYEDGFHHFTKDKASIEELIRGVRGIETDDCIKERVLIVFSEKLEDIRNELVRIEKRIY